MYWYKAYFLMQPNLTWYNRVKMGLEVVDVLTVSSTEHMLSIKIKVQEGKHTGQGKKTHHR